MTTDRVFIEDLRMETVIGIYAWEREIRQTVSLDLEMVFDIRQAAASDRIDDALNYKAVAKRLIQFVEASRFQLVESLAEQCAAIVLSEFPITSLRLKLRKPGAVRGSSAVGVVIERGRASSDERGGGQGSDQRGGAGSA
jgi:7,8-dihydroneopterin aldolase/epimerase/oxygenase